MKTLIPHTGQYMTTGPEQGLTWAIGGATGSARGWVPRHVHGERVLSQVRPDVGWNDGKPIYYCEHCRGYVSIAYLYV